MEVVRRQVQSARHSSGTSVVAKGEQGAHGGNHYLEQSETSHDWRSGRNQYLEQSETSHDLRSGENRFSEQSETNPRNPFHFDTIIEGRRKSVSYQAFLLAKE